MTTRGLLYPFILMTCFIFSGFTFFNEIPGNQKPGFRLVDQGLKGVLLNNDLHSYSPNISYYKDLQHSQDPTLQMEIFDEEVSLRLQNMWDSRTRGYDYRKQYGLTNSLDDLAQLDSVGKLSKEVVDVVKNHHMGKEVDKLGKAVDRDPFLSKMKAPAAIVVGAVAIYHGRPINVRVSQRSKLSLRTVVEKQIGEVGVESPFVNTSVGYFGKARAIKDSTPKLAAEDRLRIGISKQVLGLGAGLNYGTTTGATGASLSRRLSNHLSCTLDASKQIGSEGQNKAIAQTLRFDYGIHF